MQVGTADSLAPPFVWLLTRWSAPAPGCRPQIIREMRWFLFTVVLITLASALVCYLLLAGPLLPAAEPGTLGAAAGLEAGPSNSTTTDGGAVENFHFGTFSDTLLQLFGILMGSGLDYDTLDAVRAAVGRSGFCAYKHWV